LLDELRANTQPATPETLEGYFKKVDGMRERAAGHFGLVERDFDILDQNYEDRIRELEALAERASAQEGDVDPSAYSTETFKQRVATVKEDFEALMNRFDATAAAINQLELAGGSAEFDPARLRLVDLATELSAEMAELSLVQARVKLDSVTLSEVALDPREAFTIARDERPDLRNARAALVDSWRLVEFNANALQAGLDLVFNGDLGTARNNPVSFRGQTGRLQVGVQFDAPLTRIEERNLYRQSLIEYQQARRSYMLSEDAIYRGLRLTLRTIELNKLNFELRRGAVFIAIDQVDLTRLRLTQPPRPGETSLLGNTTARDLVDSLAQLLNVQNQFLSVWVNFELQRLNLDFDLGTMQLDSRGIWIDPGAITGEKYRNRRFRCVDLDAMPRNAPPQNGTPETIEERMLEELPSPVEHDELPPADEAAGDFTELPNPQQLEKAFHEHATAPVDEQPERTGEADGLDWEGFEENKGEEASPIGWDARVKPKRPTHEQVRFRTTAPVKPISTVSRWRNP
jgi:hypothetical protein